MATYSLHEKKGPYFQVQLQPYSIKASCQAQGTVSVRTLNLFLVESLHILPHVIVNQCINFYWRTLENISYTSTAEEKRAGKYFAVIFLCIWIAGEPYAGR